MTCRVTAEDNFQRECVVFFGEVAQILGLVPEYKPYLTSV